MSAMLETYDMPMLDYPADLDIQMHPSSSDQWLPEESKMEEDGPALKEVFSHSKNEEMTADYAEGGSSIVVEVEMDAVQEHHNIEYEMHDGELYGESRDEALDIEVYDISSAQSPSAVTFESIQEVSSDHIGPTEQQESHVFASVPRVLPVPTMETHATDASLMNIPTLNVGTNISEVEVQTSTNTEIHTPTDLTEKTLEHIQEHDHAPRQYPKDTEEQPLDPKSTPVPTPILLSQEGLVLEENFAYVPPIRLSSPPVETAERHTDVPPVGDHVEDSPSANESATQMESKDIPLDEQVASKLHDDHQYNQIEHVAQSPSANTSGDPHEISEGVYIDPPPPVLLSLGPEDQFDFSFFNESEDSKVSAGTDEVNPISDRVLLRHLPTLYYEPLSTVFDALRSDEFIQANFNTAESELFLEAVDLQLTLSEDNIYSRDVSLHDLNVLHDVSGISGLLRMRLHASAPRFITRYQYLQEHVSQLTLEESLGEPAADPNIDNEQSHYEDPHSHGEEAHNEEESVPQISHLPETSTTHEGDRQPESHEEYEPHEKVPEQSHEEPEEEELRVQEQTLEYTQPDQENEDHIQPFEEISYKEESNEAAEEELPPLPLDPSDDYEQAPSPGQDPIQGDDYVTDEGEEDEHSHTTTKDEDDAVEHGHEGNIDIVTLEALQDLPDEEQKCEEEASPEPSAHPDEVREGQATNQVFLEVPANAEHEEYELIESTLLEHEGDHAYTGLTGDADPDVLTSVIEHSDLHDTQHEASISDSFSHTEYVEPYEQRENDNPDSVLDTSALEEENWEGDADGEYEQDTVNWEDEQLDESSYSNGSSVTLSSKASKRNFDDFENDGDNQEDQDGPWAPASSPDPKRSRIH